MNKAVMAIPNLPVERVLYADLGSVVEEIISAGRDLRLINCRMCPEKQTSCSCLSEDRRCCMGQHSCKAKCPNRERLVG